MNRKTGVDPVTRILDLFVRQIVEVDLDLLSQYASLAFIGIMIVTSVRGFFNNLLKVHMKATFFDKNSAGSRINWWPILECTRDIVAVPCNGHIFSEFSVAHAYIVACPI